MVHQSAELVAVSSRIRFGTCVDAYELRPSLVPVMFYHEEPGVLGRPAVVAGHSGRHYDDGRPRPADADGARDVLQIDGATLRVLLAETVRRSILGSVDIAALFDVFVVDARPFWVVRKAEKVRAAAVMLVPRPTDDAIINEVSLGRTYGTTPASVNCATWWTKKTKQID